MLASLAVVVAFSLGAASLPVGATANAGAANAEAVHGAPRPSGIPVGHPVRSGSGLPGAAHRPLIHWSDRAEAWSDQGLAAGPAVGVRVASPARVPLGLGAAVREAAGSGATAATLGGAAGSELAAIVAGRPASVQRPAQVVRVERRRLLFGTAPATVGSRAPPAR